MLAQVGSLALIPARGGSKGIPHKNITMVAGRPLISWTIDQARAARQIDRVLVSTDDPEIAAVAVDAGAEVPFLRPPELAGDATPMVDVVVHALRWVRDSAGVAPPVVVLLQPTSPLRRPEHIDAAVDLLLTAPADTVVTVVEVPHRFSPYSVMRQDELGQLHDFWTEPLPFDRYTRQNHPPLFARNGPAVLAVRAEVVLDDHVLYGPRVRALPMAADESIDIDEPFDLDLATWLLERRAAHEAR